MTEEMTIEEKNKLNYDWAEFKKMYGGKQEREHDIRDFLLFMAGWYAHRNGGVV